MRRGKQNGTDLPHAAQTRWNRREAAEILGISYKALLYKIKEAELDKAS